MFDRFSKNEGEIVIRTIDYNFNTLTILMITLEGLHNNRVIMEDKIAKEGCVLSYTDENGELQCTNRVSAPDGTDLSMYVEMTTEEFEQLKEPEK